VCHACFMLTFGCVPLSGPVHVINLGLCVIHFPTQVVLFALLLTVIKLFAFRVPPRVGSGPISLTLCLIERKGVVAGFLLFRGSESSTCVEARKKESEIFSRE
jgi:hypothetical protein